MLSILYIIYMTNMSEQQKEIKTIRVHNNTYQKLVSFGQYSMSMDKIISSIIEKAEAKSNA